MSAIVDGETAILREHFVGSIALVKIFPASYGLENIHIHATIISDNDVFMENSSHGLSADAKMHAINGDVDDHHPHESMKGSHGAGPHRVKDDGVLPTSEVYKVRSLTVKIALFVKVTITGKNIIGTDSAIIIFICEGTHIS